MHQALQPLGGRNIAAKPRPDSRSHMILHPPSKHTTLSTLPLGNFGVACLQPVFCLGWRLALYLATCTFRVAKAPLVDADSKVVGVGSAPLARRRPHYHQSPTTDHRLPITTCPTLATSIAAPSTPLTRSGRHESARPAIHTNTADWRVQRRASHGRQQQH
jgi:hypothetical protein